MSSESLPPEALWPPHVFRVTSSITYSHEASPKLTFISPLQRRKPEDTSLEQVFPSAIKFREDLTSHLTAERVIETAEVFHSPFISITTSLRYALSVAELHYKRKGKNIIITVISTKLLEIRPPLWDAFQLASRFQTSASREDSRDEFLAFGIISGSSKSFKEVKYDNLVYKLGSFIPAVLDKKDSTKRRFCNYWEDLPKRTKPFSKSEIKAASSMARSMSSYGTMIPLMVAVLCLEERAEWGTCVIEEVVKAVVFSPQIAKEDLQKTSFRFVLNTFYGPSARRKAMEVYDFLEADYQPPEASATTHVKHVHECLAALRPEFHERQAGELKRRVDSSPTAVVAPQYVRGHVEAIVKHTDRRTNELRKVLLEFIGSAELSTAFLKLRDEVEGCRTSPLSRLNEQLLEAKGRAPDSDVSLTSY